MVQHCKFNAYFTQEGHYYMFCMQIYKNNFILKNFLFLCVSLLDPATFSILQSGKKVYHNCKEELVFAFFVVNGNDQIILSHENTKNSKF